MRNTIVALLSMVFTVVFIHTVVALSTVSVEYREDAMDYEADTQRYLRSSISVTTDYAKVYATLIKTNNGKTTATWAFSNTGEYAAIVAGYYFIHNASGLLLGKPAVYNPDPYSFPVRSGETGISLCKSGNPDYAMHGIVVSLYDRLNKPQIRLRIGASLQERFMRSDDVEEKLYPYSISGLLSHDSKDGLYSEPVNIITYFANVTLQPFEYVVVQGCYYHTGLYHENTKILFDKDSVDATALQSFGGYSLYGRYQDKILTVFTEWAIAQKEVKGNSSSPSQYNNAYLYGITVKKKGIQLRSIIQKTERYFYAPFSSSFGGNAPRDIYYYSAQIKPIRWMLLSWAYIDQNYLVPSTYYAEYPHKRLHCIRTTFTIQSLQIQTDYRLMTLYKEGAEQQDSRYQTGLDWMVTKNVSLNMKYGLYTGDDSAWYIRSGYGVQWGSLQHAMSVVYVNSNGKKVYCAMLPLSNSNILTEACSSTAVYLAMRVSYRSRLCQLSLRLLSELSHIKNGKGEFGATAWF